MDISERVIDEEYFKDLKQHTIKNYQIAEFYDNLYNESGDYTFYNKSHAIDVCCKWWDVDYFRLQNVKDVKRVNLCRDKFCFNCQSMLAIKRQSKFSPILDHFRKDYMVVHMVVTVPNCEPEYLLPLLDKMYKKFPYMMKYFKGQKKVSGINFTKYGYGACVRGLEVTYNTDTGTFHPHFHCMVLFRKDLDLTPKYINSFSYDNGQLLRKFSDLEILLQKVWFILMNDCTVTEKSINQLREGYSVTCQDSQGYYHECFKYACKGAFDESKGAFLYKEPTFRVLYQALKNRRMIQGYGLLHNFNDLDGEILDDEVNEEYNQVIAKLRQIEEPILYIESLDEVIERCGFGCRYISKSNIKRLIIERRRELDGQT